VPAPGENAGEGTSQSIGGDVVESGALPDTGDDVAVLAVAGVSRRHPEAQA
jgi:hypothetical protein